MTLKIIFMGLNKDYWESRYHENRLGWDIGYVSTPIKTYVDQLKNKELKILIPGAGYGYEAIYLYDQGFHNIWIVDIAESPIEKLRNSLPDLAPEQLLCEDFFQLEAGDFELILEQTFFCALQPSRRPDYVRAIHRQLKPGGKLVGLFFDFPLKEGPPFGGNIEEYRELFEPYFKIRVLERSYNSIPERQGTELFFIFEKKSIPNEEQNPGAPADPA